MKAKINTNLPIYNGKSIRYILGNMPKAMTKHHRNLYINNCIEVYLNEQSGHNLGYNECLRNTNFNLTLFYRNLSTVQKIG